MNVRVLKQSRTLDIPYDATKEELIEILLKWAPIVANDTNKTPFKLAEPQSVVDNIFDMFGGIFKKK